MTEVGFPIWFENNYLASFQRSGKNKNAKKTA